MTPRNPGKKGQTREHELRRELQGLRKGVGITPQKLRTARVLQACQLVQDVLSKSAAPPDEAVEVALDAALWKLGSNRYTNALRNALVLGTAVDEGNLTDRRQLFALIRDRVSIETVENWENRAIDDVIPLLLGSADADEVLAARPTDVRIDATFGTTTLPSFQVLALDVVINIATDRSIGVIGQTLRVRALKNEVMEFRRGFWSGATDRPPQIGAIDGCRVSEIVPLPNGGHQVRFELSKRLDLGQTHKFAFTRVVEQPDAQPYWSYEPQFDDVRLGMTIKFGQRPPRVVWRFDNVFGLARPGLPTSENRVVVEAGVCNQSFRAQRHVHSGIAWEW